MKLEFIVILIIYSYHIEGVDIHGYQVIFNHDSKVLSI